MLTIRSAERDDASLLAQLNRHVHTLHVEAEPHRYRPMDEHALTELLREQFKSPTRLGFIAELDEVAVGHVLGQEIRKEGHIYALPDTHIYVSELGVDPNHHGQGIGRALMEAVHHEARARGISRIRLDVRTHNAGARAFYDALGYEALTVVMERPVEPSEPNERA